MESMNGAWLALGVAGAVAAAGAAMGRGGSMARKKTFRNGERVTVVKHYGGVSRKLGRSGVVISMTEHKLSGGIGVGARDTGLYKVEMDDGSVEQYWTGELAAADATMGLGGSRNDEEDADDEMGSMAYDSMARIREANKASGGHWFERGAMRFFNTKIEGGPYGGHYFVTSEVGPDGRKAYSVRKADEDGKISTAGDFQSYSTKGAAVTAAKAMGRGGSMAHAFKTKFNRDGTVTIWDTHSGSWERTSSPTDTQLAALPATERHRVTQHIIRMSMRSASGSRDLDDEPASGSRAKTSIRNHRVVGRLSGANGDFRVYETHRIFGPDPIYYVGQIVGDGVDMHPYGHNTKAEAMASARRRAGKA